MRRRDFIALRIIALPLIALLVGAAALASAAFPTAAQAQAYPSRPITIIVPFGPGSGTDVVTRIIGQPLGIALNQSIVIDNRVGANGGIAAA
jgi:tripartite-type tricarboxylate transporter receptor subunit TctC